MHVMRDNKAMSTQKAKVDKEMQRIEQDWYNKNLDVSNMAAQKKDNMNAAWKNQQKQDIQQNYNEA